MLDVGFSDLLEACGRYVLRNANKPRADIIRQCVIFGDGAFIVKNSGPTHIRTIANLLW